MEKYTVRIVTFNTFYYLFYISGPDDRRYAVTTDVVVGEHTYIQFELVMGCQVTTATCYGNFALFAYSV